MKITIEEARKIALLSRLEFSTEDLEKMRESMNSILTHMEELNQHDTEGVEPTAHAVEQYNVMRMHFCRRVMKRRWRGRQK